MLRFGNRIRIDFSFLHTAGNLIVSPSDFLRILALAGGANAECRGDGHCDIEIAPDSIKLARHIFLMMPAFAVVLADLRIPLRHRIFYSCIIHPSAAASQWRNLYV